MLLSTHSSVCLGLRKCVELRALCARMLVHTKAAVLLKV